MKLLEVVHTAQTSHKAIITCMTMAKRLGKVAVLVKNCDGFVGNRMFAPYCAESRRLIEEGADPIKIDNAALQFGMAMGPITVSDLIGHELF